MTRTPVNRAAIYVKENVGNPIGGTEAGNQLNEAEEYCRSLGLDISTRDSDGNMSRKSFHKMMADAASGQAQFDYIVCWKLRYFAWSLDESVLARDRLRQNEIRLLSVKEKLPGDRNKRTK